jgi:NAD(P)-dependent dehydrogenase (short-subunit alcohol dehydrogenase family)
MSGDPYRLDGRRAVVVGGASGIGAATVDVFHQLGAEVVVLDVVEPTGGATPFVSVDLRNEASIDAAVDALDGPIHALASCAGVADGTAGLATINFVGQRHLLERALDAGLFPRGSAIGMVSSAAGRGWEASLDELLEYVTTPSFAAGEAWIAAHPDRGSYQWSKQAVCAYVGRKAFDFAQRGVRLNALMPGPTDTPLARANADLWLTYATDYRDAIGLTAATPEEQAWLLAFLCSPASARLIGTSIVADAGASVSRLTGAFGG